MQNKNIKVSIIVPVYNTEKYICKCLESLIAQTLKEIEIICVNDGSTDNSLKILNYYQNKDLRIKIVNQKNSGPGKSRNTGIKIAKGDFIGFVDGDDWVDKNYFEKLYNAAIKYNCEISAGDFYRQGKILKTKKLNYKYMKAFYTPTEKINQAFIPKHNYVWNKIYKREKLLSMPFPENCYYEDMRWLIKIIYNLNGFVTVPNTFYYYRKNQGSIVTQKTIKHQQDCKLAEKEIQNFLHKHNIPILIQYKLSKKIKVKLLGLKLFGIEFYHPQKIKFKLFGFIPLIEIEKLN